MFFYRTVSFQIVVLSVCSILIQVNGQLDRDNPSHRGWSNNIDRRFNGNPVWDKIARPVIHGTYHAGRYVGSGNKAEWARAKDQFSKVGTGQQQTDYLKAHRGGR